MALSISFCRHPRRPSWPIPAYQLVVCAKATHGLKGARAFRDLAKTNVNPSPRKHHDGPVIAKVSIRNDKVAAIEKTKQSSQ